MSVSETMTRLIIPECRREHGRGHLLRSLKLAELLRADILIPPDQGQIREEADAEHIVIDHIKISLQQAHGIARKEKDYDFIIFDKPVMQKEDLRGLGKSFYLGIDTGGSAREYLHYLIDTLHQGHSDANVVARNIMPTHRRTRWPDSIQRILVVGGSYDRMCYAHVKKTLSEQDVDFAGEGEFIPDLCEEFFRYDLVITHYGLAMFEALWARVPVILINPTRYHQKLAEHTGLPSYYRTRGRFPHSRLKACVEDASSLVEAGRKQSPEEGQDLLQVIRELSPAGPTFPLSPCLNRDANRSFFQSAVCIEARNYRKLSPVSYDEEYFFTDYQQQYGKTYLEDFHHIYQMALCRLREITRISRGNRLLELGCAYGHFLRAARDQGYTVRGIDISSAAVHYARDQLHLDVRKKDLNELDIEQDLGVELFDVLTMWYVLEHIPHPFSLLSRMLPCLKRGGVFAFSAPSGEGTSRRLHAQQFFLQNPPDHPVIFLPSLLQRAFAPFGLRLIHWKSTGHHPSRLSPLLAKTAIGKGMCQLWSRCLKWGDTFEAYFIKD